jgi:hypothetical protein
VVVERETWGTLFHAATFDELGRDFKISNASKNVKVVGFPPDLQSSWMRDVAITTREGKSATFFKTTSFAPCSSATVVAARRTSVAWFAGRGFHTWRAMVLLAGMHLTRQSGSDVAY